MVMGDVGTSALEQLKGYKVKQIKETDPAIFAKDVDKEYADITGSYPNSVIIGSSAEEGRFIYNTRCKLDFSYAGTTTLYRKE